MFKIDALTPEQEARIPEFVDKWTKVGLSTEPADRVRAEAGVVMAYTAAGLEPPKKFIWLGSPMAGAKEASSLQPNSNVSGQLYTSIYGQHEAGWLSFYDFFLTACGLEECEPLRGLMQVAESSGWWWAFDDVAVMTDRPAELHLDSSGRLHSETGMAIRYPDGWGFYAWHGMRVSEDIILRPETITVERIDNEQNAELRRVLLDRFTAVRYIQESKSTKVSEDRYGVLYCRDMGEDEALMMVKVRNSTPEPDGSLKDYWLRVPPTMKTPHEAVAWTFGLTAEEYTPEIET